MQNSIKVLVAALALGVSGGVFAAALPTAGTGGALGTESSENDISVEVTVNEAVKVGLEKTSVDFGTYDNPADGLVALTDTVGACVYHRGVATAGLSLLSDNSTGTDFRMKGDQTVAKYMTYVAKVKNSSGTAVSVSSGLTSITTVTADSADSTCGGNTDSSVITFDLTSVDFDATEAGDYTDTVTVTVTPI